MPLSLHVRQSAQALAHVSISSRVFNLRTKKMPIILITKAPSIAARKNRNKSQTICCVAESSPTMTTPSQNSISSARPVISGNYIVDHDFIMCTQSPAATTKNNNNTTAAANSIDFISKWVQEKNGEAHWTYSSVCKWLGFCMIFIAK